MLKVIGHTAPVEALLSGMPNTKTRIHNPMNVESSKMFTMIRIDMARSIPETEKKQKKPKEIWR